MPPKAKFSKGEIVEAAFNIVRADGVAGLTARALGEKLESSARPIFTVFQSMNELQEEVIKEAKALYGEYVKRGLSTERAFKGVGTQYILFSIKEPKLFQLLFMAEQKNMPNLSGILPLIDNNYEMILESVMVGYGVDNNTAQRIYKHLWIYTHGIAALCATKMCRFSGEEISEMITDVLNSIIMKMKAEKANDKY